MLYCSPRDSSVSLGGSGGGFFNVLSSILRGTAGLADAAAPILPDFGIGSRSRLKELEAKNMAEMNILNTQQSIIDEKASDQRELLIIGGVFLLVIMVMILALRT